MTNSLSDVLKPNSRRIMFIPAVPPPERTVLGGVDCDAFVLINILNPKLSIFFLAFLPQFVSADEADALSRMVGLSAMFVLLTLIVFIGYGLFATAIRSHLISHPQVMVWMRRAFAGAFVALGANLALAER